MIQEKCHIIQEKKQKIARPNRVAPNDPGKVPHHPGKEAKNCKAKSSRATWSRKSATWSRKRTKKVFAKRLQKKLTVLGQNRPHSWAFARFVGKLFFGTIGLGKPRATQKTLFETHLRDLYRACTQKSERRRTHDVGEFFWHKSWRASTQTKSTLSA